MTWIFCFSLLIAKKKKPHGSTEISRCNKKTSFNEQYHRQWQRPNKSDDTHCFGRSTCKKNFVAPSLLSLARDANAMLSTVRGLERTDRAHRDHKSNSSSSRWHAKQDLTPTWRWRE
jgi:hypothetical protein